MVLFFSKIRSFYLIIGNMKFQVAKVSCYFFQLLVLYMYIYIYIHICVYKSQIFRIHPLIQPSIHPSIHPYIHTYLHTYIHTFIHTYIHTYMLGCWCYHHNHCGVRDVRYAYKVKLIEMMRVYEVRFQYFSGLQKKASF